MDIIKSIQNALQQAVTIVPKKRHMFFKTGPGEYAEHDQFIGVTVPNVRRVAKDFYDAPRDILQQLLTSVFNEERLLALCILVQQYKRADKEAQEELYTFYLDHLEHINNWNLVDASAHLIIGAHLYNRDKDILLSLATSPHLWSRRIAIVATWYFIRNNDLTWTFKLALILQNDSHDLMHKSVGWMLREAGKRDQQKLIAYLDQHAKHMPRTMLRYAIEKLSVLERIDYLNKVTNKK